MGLGSKIPERSKPIARTQSDVAQEKKDDYSRRYQARQQTLLSESQNANTQNTPQKKTLLGA